MDFFGQLFNLGEARADGRITMADINELLQRNQLYACSGGPFGQTVHDTSELFPNRTTGFVDAAPNQQARRANPYQQSGRTTDDDAIIDITYEEI